VPRRWLRRQRGTARTQQARGVLRFGCSHSPWSSRLAVGKAYMSWPANSPRISGERQRVHVSTGHRPSVSWPGLGHRAPAPRAGRAVRRPGRANKGLDKHVWAWRARDAPRMACSWCAPVPTRGRRRRRRPTLDRLGPPADLPAGQWGSRNCCKPTGAEALLPLGTGGFASTLEALAPGPRDRQRIPAFGDTWSGTPN